MSTMNKKRKYSESYLQFGFTSITKNEIEIPQCLICQKTLANESMKPSLLARHMEKMHPNFKEKDVSFFKRKEESLKKQRLDASGAFLKQYNGIAAKEMVRCIIGEESAKKLNTLSLSNNTVKRRIEDMSRDILSRVLAK